MFSEPITRAYDMTDATWEIIVMLLVSFALGYLLRWILSSNEKTAPKKTVLAIPPKYATFKKDDLKIVEGIGPKIEALLKAHGIQDWKALAAADVATLKNILNLGGERFVMHDPKSWPDQAALAIAGRWKELEEFQNILVGGR
jgi:hypothetical protein